MSPLTSGLAIGPHTSKIWLRSLSVICRKCKIDGWQSERYFSYFVGSMLKIIESEVGRAAKIELVHFVQMLDVSCSIIPSLADTIHVLRSVFEIL